MEEKLYGNANFESYSFALRKLVEDMGEEFAHKVNDGLIARMISLGDDKAGLYDFFKKEGYDLKYKEYESFIDDCKEITDKNMTYIEKTRNESKSEELCDDSLEQVVGGWSKKTWGSIFKVAGVVALGVGLTIVTAGIGGGLAMGLTVTAVLEVAASSAVVGTGMVVAGAGAGVALVGSGLGDD